MCPSKPTSTGSPVSYAPFVCRSSQTFIRTVVKGSGYGWSATVTRPVALGALNH